MSDGDQSKSQADIKADVLSDPYNVIGDAELDNRAKALLEYARLPPAIKKRVKALKKMQSQFFQEEGEFYKRMNDLEEEYAAKYDELYKKRTEIIIGTVEPTDDQCDWPSDTDSEADNDEPKAKEEVKIEDETKDTKTEQDQLGIPNFWLAIFRNCMPLSDMLQEHDEPIIEKLNDITVNLNISDSSDKYKGFTLIFHFAPNDFFTNSTLTKEYYVKFDPPTKKPLEYEGPEIVKTVGCKIEWKQGKNVTVKQIKKTIKAKSRGEKKTVMRTVKQDSFFNFFDPPKDVLDIDVENVIDEDDEAILHADFEVGQFLRERIITRAVLYYTGEAIEDDDDDDDLDEDDQDDDDDDDLDGDGNIDDKAVASAAPDCKTQ